MKVKTKAIISLLVIILFILITNTKVQAKSYYIDDMQIEATVQDNGNLQVEQTLKYACVLSIIFEYPLSGPCPHIFISS